MNTFVIEMNLDQQGEEFDWLVTVLPKIKALGYDEVIAVLAYSQLQRPEDFVSELRPSCQSIGLELTLGCNMDNVQYQSGAAQIWNIPPEFIWLLSDKLRANGTTGRIFRNWEPVFPFQAAPTPVAWSDGVDRFIELMNVIHAAPIYTVGLWCDPNSSSYCLYRYILSRIKPFNVHLLLECPYNTTCTNWVSVIAKHKEYGFNTTPGLIAAATGVWKGFTQVEHAAWSGGQHWFYAGDTKSFKEWLIC